jgi:glycosyltransferase involved in cell wall biosynthesis
MNILFIASPNSIHDLKWMSYFSQKNTDFKVFLIFENNQLVDQKSLEKLKHHNIYFLNPIAPYSISTPFKTLKSIRDLKRIVVEKKIDAIHVLFATPYALWMNYLHTPYIITTRGSDVLKVLPALLTERGVKRLYFNSLFNRFRKSFRNATLITSTSFLQVKAIAELFPNISSHVIRTGVNVDGIVKATNKNCLPVELRSAEFIFSPRFFCPIYNIEIQIEAIEQLSIDVIRKYIFVFVKGKYSDSSYADEIEKKLISLSDAKGLNYRIENFLDQETLWTYYNYASLTIMTPLSDGTPNSALEAMSAKCPLIIPNLDYDKELFDATCLVLLKNDSETLARMIEEGLINYPQSLIESAFIKVNEYGNRRHEMEKMNRLYRQYFKSVFSAK